ncbi:MAG: hypothetical protein HOL85_18345 [Rhodospirillaceae bacterium]|jgi:hypothetical protein|nr:hypothetical protein [Rhodospirillaceae bacterium]MBT6137120.1 hypothetical protein [Rhodospirillaceae bacterium]
MITRIAATALSVFLFAGPTIASAGEADVVKVEIRKEGARTYSFSVTLAHGDVGWKHYADAWEVVGPDGTVLGKRVLFHPHVNEQPFTRSLGGVKIPAGVAKVTLRAHDLVHGTGGKVMTVVVPE